MNKVFLTLGIIFLCANTLSAKLKIPVGKVDKLEIVAELPDTEDYKDGPFHLNLARLHQEYIFAWLPIWITEEPKLVLARDENATSYYELSAEQLNEILIANELDKDKLLPLGFYTRFGGKAIILLIIVGGAFFYLRTR